MKKEEDIFYFSFIHLLLFPSLYSYIFNYFQVWILFFFVMMLLSLFSFLAILLGYFLDRKQKIKIPEIGYVILSICLSSISIFIFRNGTKDPRIFFPILEEPIWLISSINAVSHIIAYILVTSFRKIINKKKS